MNLLLLAFDFRLSTRASRGFTLVELLISISVLMVLTGTVLASYRGYNNNAYFANASEDIVLALRQAQVYGVGVKGDNNLFQVPYGVYLDNNPLKNNKMVLFADTSPFNGDGLYTQGSDKLIETIEWKDGIGITDLVCDIGPCNSNVISITFKRPNPDAFITEVGGVTTRSQLVEITIGNGAPAGSLKTSKITVTQAGQIYLEKII